MSRLHEIPRSAKEFEAVWSARRTFEFVDDTVAANDVLHLIERADVLDHSSRRSGRELLLIVTYLHTLDTHEVDGRGRHVNVASVKLLARLNAGHDAAITPYTQERPGKETR